MDMLKNIKSTTIDEGLYSRQLYVLGFEAMQQMAGSVVLVSGLGGLGVEIGTKNDTRLKYSTRIAKNIILAGVKAVILHDQALTSMYDLGAQFYLKDSGIFPLCDTLNLDIGHYRADSCCSKLSELNGNVVVLSLNEPLTEDVLKLCQVNYSAI